MHDIQTIAKLNAEATADAIKHYCDQGRWVVASYTGLHIDGLETFTDEGEALALLRSPVSIPGQSRTLHPPTPASQCAPRSGDRTLRDYIDRKAEDHGVVVTHNATVAGQVIEALASADPQHG